MRYVELRRPNGDRVNMETMLSERDEKLAQACLDHERGSMFTYEDCGTFINLCFEAEIKLFFEDGESETEVADVVCEVVPLNAVMADEWSKVIAKAADILAIHVPEEA